MSGIRIALLGLMTHQIPFRASLFLFSLLIFTNVQGYNVCRDLFFESVPDQKALLKELIKNRTLPIVPGGQDKNGHRISWFISHSLEGEAYTVTLIRSTIGDVVAIRADWLSPSVEAKYYRQAAQYFTSIETTLTLPRKGTRRLIIPAEVQVKLFEKHALKPNQILEALKKISPNVKYKPNNHVAYQGRDSFLFFIEVGQRTPLEVVMLHENGVYQLITAFFPDVYYHK